MPLRRSAQAINRVQGPTAMASGNAVAAFAEFTTVAGQFLAADVIEMLPWPAGTIPVDLKLHVEDLDSGGSPAVTLDVGLLSGNWLADKDDAGADRTCGVQFGDNLTTGQAGGSVVATPAQLLALAPSLRDRSLGIKVEAAPATLIVGAKIRMSAIFVPAPQGVAFVA